MRLPANLGRLLPALCLGVLLSACSTFGQRDPLRIDLVGLEPLPGQGMEMRFMVKLRVQNPNDEPIEYNGIALDTVRFSEKGTLDFSGPAVGAPKTKGL